MNKPEIEFETRVRDAFLERTEYEMKGLFPDADDMALEQIMSFVNAVYVEGYLDGFRTADYLYQLIT